MYNNVHKKKFFLLLFLSRKSKWKSVLFVIFSFKKK